MFIDEVKIKVIAGDGGDGCLAFRREKFVAMGGPYGGNGGKGGDIIFKADSGLHTLIDLRYQKVIKASKGENGRGKNQYGEQAEDVIIKVPVGTIIKDIDTNMLIADLDKHNSEVVVAKGGRGGKGNTAFKTHNNPAPNFAENGEPGEEKELLIELKLLADVGLVGFPSVGKSTIISKVSASKPKIAQYHFTTLVPNLGVCRAKNGKSFVMCDLPGLIEGASEGIGLGDKFLKHIERCSVIAHVIDMGKTEGRNPYEDYLTINNELKKYSEKLFNKPQIIIANKMDVSNALNNLKEFKKKVDKEIIEISAIKGEGLDEMLLKLSELVEKYYDENKTPEETLNHIIYEYQEEEKPRVEIIDQVFYVKSKALEKLYKMTNFNTLEAEKRFLKRIDRMGVNRALKESGIVDGNKVNIYGLEFYYED